MPRRKAEVSSDEDYVVQSSSSSDDYSSEEYDDDDDDDYSPEADRQPTTPTRRAGRTGKQSPIKNIKQDEPEEKPVGDPNAVKRKRKSRINYKDPMIDDLPSTQRKTEAGGYAHTNKSKERISKANRGNKPWNKGKQRSSADKAKIKAGVQARNRAIKLEKLKVCIHYL